MIENLRKGIIHQYIGEEFSGDFGEILGHEMHENKMTFKMLAKKWNISLPCLGELINDHCKRL
jgi:hypothetical protein